MEAALYPDKQNPQPLHHISLQVKGGSSIKYSGSASKMSHVAIASGSPHDNILY